MKDLNKLIRTARRQGWEVEKRKRSGHWRFTNPAGQSYFTSSTPSDWRSCRNLLSGLRKLGLDYDELSDRRRRPPPGDREATRQPERTGA